MSAVYGVMESDKSKRVTRAGNRYITSVVQTWEGGLELTLWSDGSFELIVTGPPYGSGGTGRKGNTIAEGYIQPYVEESFGG